MKTPDPAGLGRLESQVMRVVWRLGEARVPDVQKALDWDRPLAYTTVMTVMSRLAEKGFLAREKEGRFYVYRPLVARERIGRTALRGVVERFYDGLTASALAQLLAEDQSLGEDELAELESLIRSRREEGR